MNSHNSSPYLLGLALGLGAAMSIAACGGGGGGAGGTGGGTSSSSSSSTSTSTSSSTTSSSSNSSASSSSGSGACTEITLGTWTKGTADGSQAVYKTTPTPDLGDTADTDDTRLEFYGSAVDPMYDGEGTGMFDLAMGGDANYATCSRCVVLQQDPTAATPKAFFQMSGKITVDAASDQLNGTVTATLTDVTLVEVDIDSGTFTSTPVPGGACVHIATATVSYMTVPPPAGWTCDAMYYGDGPCDCGCGVQDSDCADLLVATCEYCDDTGSCNTDTCPGTINATNNAVCGP